MNPSRKNIRGSPLRSNPSFFPLRRGSPRSAVPCLLMAFLPGLVVPAPGTIDPMLSWLRLLSTMHLMLR